MNVQWILPTIVWELNTNRWLLTRSFLSVYVQNKYLLQLTINRLQIVLISYVERDCYQLKDDLKEKFSHRKT